MKPRSFDELLHDDVENLSQTIVVLRLKLVWSNKKLPKKCWKMQNKRQMQWTNKNKRILKLIILTTKARRLKGSEEFLEFPKIFQNFFSSLAQWPTDLWYNLDTTNKHHFYEREWKKLTINNREKKTLTFYLPQDAKIKEKFWNFYRNAILIFSIICCRMSKEKTLCESWINHFVNVIVVKCRGEREEFLIACKRNAHLSSSWNFTTTKISF